MEEHGSASSEGERIVKELLDSILQQDVFSVSPWDIANVGRTISQKGEQISNGTKEEQGTSVNYDLCSLIRNHTPSRILINYTLKDDSHVEVLQLKCTEQQASGYCGHYALHNALCLLEACHSLNEEAVLGCLGETDSIGGFWRRYWMSMSQLLMRAHAEQMWPWTEDYVNRGDMERSFMRYLFQVDPHLNANNRQDKIIVMQYSFGLLQDNFETICNIQDKISSFLSSPGTDFLIFILGVTNHWVTLLAYKTKGACPCPSSCGRGQVKLVYMDSNNAPVMGYTDKGIEDHIVEQEKKRIARKGRGYETWEREVIYQAYIDQRAIIRKLVPFLNGERDLREEMADEYTSKLLKSFRSQVDETLSSNGFDLYVPLLINWMDHHYPPKILQDNLLPFLATVDKLDMSCLEKLGEWAGHNLNRLQSVECSGLPHIDSFVELLETILKRLKM